jgi:hypothetical protein
VIDNRLPQVSHDHEADLATLQGHEPAVGDDAVVIYLSGSIKKGDSDSRDSSNFWTESNVDELLAGLADLTVKTINPATAGIKRSDYWANFGCDLSLVSSSDFIVVDARTTKGIGVGAEMMYAHQCQVPIISVAPRNSTYRRDSLTNVCGEDLENWIHPFIYGLSSAIVESFNEAGELIAQVAHDKRHLAWRSVDEAIEHYKSASKHWA